MSDYTGRPYEDILTLLNDEDFKEIKKEMVTSDEEPGTIIEQDPSPGSEVVPSKRRLLSPLAKGQRELR